MSVQVAEYLGQRADGSVPVAPSIATDKCPFTQSKCIKISRKRGSNKPVCSILTSKGLYVVCTNRIFPTSKENFRAEHRGLLFQIAEQLFPGLEQDSFRYRPKTQVVLNLRSLEPESHPDQVELDYVLVNLSPRSGDVDKIILEVQGGGETGNTGVLTEHVDSWERSPGRTNTLLHAPIQGVGTIQNNAWKRQLEQMIRKGRLAQEFGGGFALALGTLVFSYFLRFMRNGSSDVSKKRGWTIALVEMEDSWYAAPKSAVSFRPGRVLYFMWDDLIESLRQFQVECDDDPFKGRFFDVGGKSSPI